MHDGNNGIIDGQHNHDHHHKKSDMIIKIIAGVIVIGLIAAFIVWRLT